MTGPLTKEQIEEAKVKQRAIIADCDKAINDLNANIVYFQNAIAQHKAARKQAKDTLIDLEDDFPMASGTTTKIGGADGRSIVDSSLIGSTLKLVDNSLRVYPGDPLKDDIQLIETFNKLSGKVETIQPFKGGQVGIGAAYKIFKPIPSIIKD